MPSFGRQKNKVIGSPFQGVFTGFDVVPIPGVRRGRTLDSARSPAGMHPVTPGYKAHLRRLYNELRKDETKLSREAFEHFILTRQRDNKKPSWGFSQKPECTAFTFEQFVELWWNEYSAAKRPIHAEDKDLDKPISNYFISSSHNTYIEDGNQFSGAADVEQYRKVSCPTASLQRRVADRDTGPRNRMPVCRDRCVGWRGSR